MTPDIRGELEDIAGIVEVIYHDEPDGTALDSGGIGVGWRQACTRIAEMIRDRTAAIDRSRNVSGNENGNLLHEHGHNSAPAEEQTVVGAQIKWLEAAERYFEYRPTLGEDMAYWANVQNAGMCRKIATSLSSCTATALTEARAEIERLRGAHEADIKRLKIQRDNALLDMEAFMDRAATAESELSTLRARVREVVGPFAAAADDICDQSSDSAHIWEAPCAMNITRGHLRAARAFIAEHGSDSKGE